MGKKAQPALWIFATALLAVLPLCFRGVSCGHDFDFHLLSWVETARAWGSGVLYPHWLQYANYGAGEPRMIFYPPASWMLGAALIRVTSWQAAPVLFVLLALLGCGWSMYSLGREWVSPRSATLAACFYAANPYALFVIYERSDFSELLAAVWMPLVILFALRKPTSIASLALAIAAVWLTNDPAAVLAMYTLVVLVAAMALQEKDPWRVLRAAGGALLGLGLASVYIVPAVYQQGWVEITRAIIPGLSVQDNFLFGHTSDALHDQVLRTASWILLSEMAVALLAAWLAWRKRSICKVEIALSSLLSLILFLQLPISAGIWKHLPDLRFLQFPWRWLVVLSPVTCLFIGMAVDAKEAPALPRRLAEGVCGGAVVLMILGATHLFFQQCDLEDSVAGQLDAFRMGPAAGGVEGTDGYTPAQADNSEIERGLPFVRVLATADQSPPDIPQQDNPQWLPGRDDAVPAEVHSKEEDTEHWKISVHSQHTGYAVLRLMDYPAWRVTVDGTPIHTRPRRDDGLMAVPVPKGNSVIDIRWENTPDAILGRVFSSVSVIFLLGLWRRRSHRKKGSRHPKQATAKVAVK